MQERKVSIGDQTHVLPAPFLVIATQNPVEQAGTFELPEAQLDRFMLCHRLTYPEPEDETEVVRRSLKLKLMRQGDGAVPMSAFDAITESGLLHVNDLTAAMGKVQEVHVSEVFIRDCVELIHRREITHGSSLGAAREQSSLWCKLHELAHFSTDEAMRCQRICFALAEDVIMHRIRLTYEALADGLRPRDVLKELLESMT